MLLFGMAGYGTVWYVFYKHKLYARLQRSR